MKDFFISYDVADQIWAEWIAWVLEESNYTVTIQAWDFRPGSNLVLNLQQAISNSRRIVVVLSEHYLKASDRQLEWAAAFRQDTETLEHKLLPVRVARCNPLGLLGSIAYVDLVDKSEAIAEQELLNAFKPRAKPSSRPQPPELKLIKQRISYPGTPYRGLRAFTTQDSEVFFGRDSCLYNQGFAEETSHYGLMHQVEVSPFTAVVGASGSGKSSLVFAGLIPKLQETGQWIIDAFRPGSEPFEELAIALVRQLEPDLPKTERLIKGAKLATSFRSQEISLSRAVAATLEAHNRLFLLVIDQFEEVFSETPENIRKQFLLFLFQAIGQQTNLRIIVTLRADFLGWFYRDSSWFQILTRGRFDLLPMSESDLRDVIEGPAKSMEASFQDGLVRRILDDCGSSLNVLSLLELTLTKLWESRTGNQLTHDDYEQIGPVQKAISKHAEYIYVERLSEEQREISRSVFLKLINIDTQSLREDSVIAPESKHKFSITKRLFYLSQLSDSEKDLVGYLSGPEARLVSVNLHSRRQEAVVEIVHETLIDGWQRLLEWIANDYEFLVWRNRFQATLQEWMINGQDENSLLRGKSLEAAESHLRSRSEDFSKSEQQFIYDSRQFASSLYEAEEQRSRLQQEMQDRSKKWISISLVGLGVGVVATTATIAFLGFQAHQTRAEQEILETSSKISLEATPEKLPIVKRIITKADQFENQGATDKALSYYRGAFNYTYSLVMSETGKRPDCTEVFGEASELFCLSEEGLVKLIENVKLPVLKTQLEESKIGDIVGDSVFDFQDIFSEGALQTTYAILWREDGVYADMDDSGLISPQQEADKLPCPLLKKIEEIWKSYGGKMCGWYNPQEESFFSSPGCELLDGHTLTQRVFEDINDSILVRNRLKYCELSP
jgi:energy-coupling factor transporter ATP-binding protein EcfA2